MAEILNAWDTERWEFSTIWRRDSDAVIRTNPRTDYVMDGSDYVFIGSNDLEVGEN